MEKEYINILIQLRNIYMINVDSDGDPKSSIIEMVNTWTKVNKLLDISEKETQKQTIISLS